MLRRFLKERTKTFFLIMLILIVLMCLAFLSGNVLIKAIASIVGVLVILLVLHLISKYLNESDASVNGYEIFDGDDELVTAAKDRLRNVNAKLPSKLPQTPTSNPQTFFNRNEIQDEENNTIRNGEEVIISDDRNALDRK